MNRLEWLPRTNSQECIYIHYRPWLKLLYLCYTKQLSWHPPSWESLLFKCYFLPLRLTKSIDEFVLFSVQTLESGTSQIRKTGHYVRCKSYSSIEMVKLWRSLWGRSICPRVGIGNPRKRKSAYHPLRSLKDRDGKKAIGRWSPKGESQDPFNKK